MHYPVLLAECLEWLGIDPAGTYVDCTSGLGGHTIAIAKRLDTGSVIACDRDPESLAMARRNAEGVSGRIVWIESRFSQLAVRLGEAGVVEVNGLLADLGVSRYQLTDAERGFSLTNDGPLDMRMNRESGESAGGLVNFSSEKDLADLIYQLGEERRARRIARAIVRARPIRSTAHLAQVVEEAAPRTGRIHPATQTFMALRMAVNEEQNELQSLLDAIPAIVKPGGRAAIISFMSLEDRMVKRSFQALARGGRASILTKHVIRPGGEEIGMNAASRSAKLRVIEMN